MRSGSPPDRVRTGQGPSSGYVEDHADRQLIFEAAAAKREIIIELFGSAGDVSCR
jgi:hypothetical protein